jgi:hypothetical protein
VRAVAFHRLKAVANKIRAIAEMKEYTKLERAVLEWMADRLLIPNLKEQIAAAAVTGREYTGVGFFTRLSVPSDVPAIQCPSPISGPVIEAEGIAHDGGAIIFLDDTGHITQLEMYANGDRFAESITSFELRAWDESNQALDGTA